MPLTAKGSEIMANMQKHYGKEKGEQVFYASANAGKITGVHDAIYSYHDACRRGDSAGMSSARDRLVKR